MVGRFISIVLVDLLLRLISTEDIGTVSADLLVVAIRTGTA
jgi:hypothetical protein